MNTRELILKTADHLERNPSLYSFSKPSLPTRSDPRACVVGRMANLNGTRSRRWLFGYPKIVEIDGITEEVLGISFQYFCGRMMYIVYQQCISDQPDKLKLWTFYPEDAAWALRKYADKYHPDLGYQKFRDALVLEGEYAPVVGKASDRQQA